MKILGVIPYYVGPDQKIIAKSNRIYFIEEDTAIDDKIILLEGFPEVFPQPEANRELFEKNGNCFIADKSNHELAMLLIENDEIVLFSGCSHSGIINIIDEVKLLSRNMKMKATFGGLHLYNPTSEKNESQEYIAELTKAPVDTAPVFYTGHCTGEKNYLSIKGRMGNKIITLNTGEVIEI
jgi:7,8-dihydropterin-6-yl-methyl-4-(beta-D-ribofuranosyl)aminobenzene 5'-phosphate synthase